MSRTIVELIIIIPSVIVLLPCRVSNIVTVKPPTFVMGVREGGGERRGGSQTSDLLNLLIKTSSILFFEKERFR